MENTMGLLDEVLSMAGAAAGQQTQHAGALSAVVNLMNPGHIDAVFIAGRIRKWRGSLVGVDTGRVMREAAEARDRVMRRAGFKIGLVS